MFVVVGTTTVDLIMTGLDRLPQAGGDEFTGESLAFLDTPMTMTLGGNGANAAVVLAALGAPTSLCSVVGTDAFGEIALRWLGERRVRTEAVRQDLCDATAATAIVTDRGRNRIAFHHAGGSGLYGPEHLRRPPAGSGDTLLLTSYHLLPHFRGEPGAALLAGARSAGARTALDLGPAVGHIAGPAELSGLLTYVDFLLANSYELAACTGENDVEGGAAAALSAGAQRVVVKRGADGASVHDSGGHEIVRGFPVEVQSTVGAGDAFDAGFLHAIAGGAPVGDALLLANAVAALVVSSRQGILSAPSLNEVEKFMRQG
jgi:sugar/nucleoside kinase (ribokinase family)